MPDPTFAEIHNYSENWETSLKALLVTAGIETERIHKQRGKEKLQSARVDLQFQVGNETGHKSRDHFGKYIPDSWMGNIRFTIVADRTLAPDYIQATKQKILNLFARWQDVFTTSTLPYYKVYTFKDPSPTGSIQADKDRDVCILNFSLMFAINVFWNTAQEYTASCSGGMTGTPVIKTTAAGTHFSFNTRDTANAAALAAATTAANAELVCYYVNEEQEYTAQCGAGTLGNSVTVTIDAGEVDSLISVEDANAQALAQATSEANAALVCVRPELFVALPSTSQINSTNWNTIAQDVDSFIFSSATDKMVSLRLRGIAESKTYTGGSVSSGWLVGGAPAATSFNYYKLEISSPAQTYYLNSVDVQAGGTSSRIWDFTKTVRINAGATVALTAVSMDNQQLGSEGKVVPTYAGLPLPVSQPYAGQFYLVQATAFADV